MEAALRETTASVATAEDGVREAESLVVEATARVTSADAAVTRAAAVVAAAQLDVDFCDVRAPVAGRAGRRLVDRGNVVAAGTSTLVSIQRLDPMYVDFSVPEDDLSRVAAKMGATPLTVELRLPDDVGPPRTGTLTFLDNAVDPATGTVKMRATVVNGDRHFWPGRFARVRLVLETLKGAVLVPATAPLTTAQGTVVLVVKADDTAAIRPVTLGQRHGDRVVLTAGVAPGDRVIVAGQARRDGRGARARRGPEPRRRPGPRRRPARREADP